MLKSSLALAVSFLCLISLNTQAAGRFDGAVDMARQAMKEFNEVASVRKAEPEPTSFNKNQLTDEFNNVANPYKSSDNFGEAGSANRMSGGALDPNLSPSF